MEIPNDVKPTKPKEPTKTKKDVKNAKSKSIADFLKTHAITKSETGEQLESTNTRIGDSTSGIYGGNYHISNEDYPDFLKLYYRDILSKGKPEYLTERQLTTDGPILVDVDLRFPYELTQRQYTTDHIHDLVDLYLEELKPIFQFEHEAQFPIYIYEKTAVNQVAEKNCTKDGIHMIFGIQADRITQQILRKRIINRIDQTTWENIPITNSWEDVFDEGISKGTTNWQLHGSCKPKHEAYKITYIKMVEFNTEDGEFSISDVNPSTFNVGENIERLSIRYRDHYAPFIKSSFQEEYKRFGEMVGTKKSAEQGIATGGLGGVVGAGQIIGIGPSIATSVFPKNAEYCSIKNAEELTNALKIFLDSIDKENYEIKETYEYVMILPETYYTSFEKWIRVGWALKNVGDCMFIIWLAFSSQWPKFKYGTEIRDLYDRWQTFDVQIIQGTKGLTKRSILHWAKQDAQDKFKEIHKNSVDYYIDQILSTGITITADDKIKMQKCGDFDIAFILYQIFKDEYVCSNIKNNIWYKFHSHKWIEIDSATDFRLAMSKNTRELFHLKKTKLMSQAASITDNESPLRKAIENRAIKASQIIEMLGSAHSKRDILREAADLFYDRSFINKLDENHYLTCFRNGVMDFNEGVFRPGKPEDCLSRCTNIDYVPPPPPNDPIVIEIHDFMTKLFPHEELRKYMWEHLASTLIGGNPDQTFNNYIGHGQNGKSVLINLMEKVLGDYKADAPLSLITQKRVQTGGVSPEIVALKGVRFAVMQEPSKGDKIIEGMLKQITGCDNIQGRALFQNCTSFKPQFKLVVCANHFMEIDARDHGTWRRIRVADFESLFTDNPVLDNPDKPYQFKLDRNIHERFSVWKEIFASMLIEIAKNTKGRVRDCAKVIASSNAYKMREDVIAAYISEKIEKQHGTNLRKPVINLDFTTWFQTQNGTRPNKSTMKELHEAMDAEFGKAGKKGWENVGIQDDIEGDDKDQPIDPNFAN